MAWAALYQWADVTDDETLRARAAWLYTHETTAAQNYWLNDPRQLAGYANYQYNFVSLVWGGKRDFATFFSPRPQAMLGIQLIPMSTGHEYLRNTDISNHLEQAGYFSAGPSGQFGDYMVMYDALIDPNRALKNADTLDDTGIDDGNSKTYLYAWLYSQLNHANYR